MPGISSVLLDSLSQAKELQQRDQELHKELSEDLEPSFKAI